MLPFNTYEMPTLAFAVVVMPPNLASAFHRHHT